MFRYLLSYTSTESYGTNNGNCEITLPRPITSMKDVTALTELLRQEFNLSNPLLLSFSRFDDPAPRKGEA